jgi:hypothetical protein
MKRLLSLAMISAALIVSGCGTLNDGRLIRSAAEQIANAFPVEPESGLVATNTPPSASTGENTSASNGAPAVVLVWDCGGEDGSKHKTDPSVRITSSRLTTATWFYTQTPPELSGWPIDSTPGDGKACYTMPSLFWLRADGKYHGGKVDHGYGTATPKERPLSAHVQSSKPYKGHKPFVKGQRYAGVLLSYDGRKSETVVGVVE